MINSSAISAKGSRPTREYLERMRLYSRSMFPLPVRFINAVILYGGFSVLFCRVNRWPIDLVSLPSMLAISNLFLLALILRLMDELKDLDIDRRLFSDRPVPSGRVFESDIQGALVFCSAVYIILNLLSPATLWIALISLGYTFLMFAYFFIPNILRRNLLLNLATHNPSVPLMLAMTAIIVAVWQNKSVGDLDMLGSISVIIMFWSPILGWELSRKIRSAEEENEYATYSQIFGRVPASLMTLAVQTIPVIIGLYFALTLPLSGLYPTLLLLAYAVALFGHLRFIFYPSPFSSRLRPFAEAYTLLALLAGIIDYLVPEVWR